MLNFTAITPSRHLQSIVQRFVFTEGVIPDGLSWTHLLTPSMAETIYFNLNQTLQAFVFNDGTRLDLKDGVFTSQMSSAFKTHFSGHVKLLGIHIHVPGIYRLFNIPIRQNGNNPILLEDILGRQAIQLSNELRELRSLREIVTRLETFLTNMVITRKANPHPLLFATLSSISDGKGKMPISEIAWNYKTSERNLQKIFLDQVGMSPKMYSRLYRFNEVIHSMNANTFSWKYAAENLGYFDQAHFIKDFKGITGVNPSQFFANHTMVNKFFSEY